MFGVNSPFSFELLAICLVLSRQSALQFLVTDEDLATDNLEVIRLARESDYDI